MARDPPDLRHMPDATQERTSVLTEDTAAFAASPSSVHPVPVPVTVANPSLSPSLSPRKCEGCAAAHPGTYGSGRFCSATCAKKVGARHKWAARAAPGASRRPGPARRAVADAPCESCAKLHDRSYGSGRFCSVHCARRVAATRKWEKSRSEKNKRLEAIRPAMLAPPLPPSPLAGKRRRVVARGMEGVHLSDPGQSFYVTGTAYAVPRPVEAPPPNHTSVLTTAPVASYLPPAPQAQMHYHQAPSATPVDSSVMGPQLVYANHALSAGSAPAHSAMYYGQPTVPAYRVVHPAVAPAVDTGAYSLMTQSPSPPPTTTAPSQRQPLQYAPASPLQRAAHDNYPFQRTMAFDMEAVSATASPAPFEEPQSSEPLIPPFAVGSQANLGRNLSTPSRTKGEGGVVEGSESAARALLCLRATNSGKPSQV